MSFNIFQKELSFNTYLLTAASLCQICDPGIWFSAVWLYSTRRKDPLHSIRWGEASTAKRPEGRVLGRPYCKILFPLISFLSCFSFENASFAARVHFPRCYKREEYCSTQFSQVSPAESVRHDDLKSGWRPTRWPPAENREKIETRQMRFRSWHLAFS